MIDCSTNLVEYNDRAQEESNFQRKIIIPLKDLNYLGFITTNSISFTTKYFTIRITDNPGKSSTKMFFKLWFETDQEDNLATRFDKAMLNLKNYLKSGKSKETF